MNHLLISVFTLLVIFCLEGVFPHFKGRHGRLRHGLPNIILGSCNGFIMIVLFGGLTLQAINWAETYSFGSLRLLNVPWYAKVLLAFLLFDLWMYLWHFINHKNLFLWRFHRMHHTDFTMDTTTALRFHPGEIVFSSLLNLPVFILIGLSMRQLIIYRMFLQPIILFHHSNVALPERVDRIFRALIVTPNMHRVHHSQQWSETNSNYASVFSFWDRLFNTFRKREDTRTIKFGLKILPEPEWQRLSGLLLTPFREIIRRRKKMRKQ